MTLKDGLSKIARLQIATLKDCLSKITKSNSDTKIWPIKDNQVKIMTLKDGLSKITTVKLQVLTRITNYFFGVLGMHIYTRRGSKQKVAVLKESGKLSFYSFVLLFYVVQ